METAKPVIFYVDDNQLDLDLFKYSFENEYEIITTTSVNEAFDILELNRNRINVIFSDERMPEMMGSEFLTRVREQFPGIPRVLVTADDQSESIINAVNKARIDYYIRKPWQFQNLKMVIDKFVQIHSLKVKANSMEELLEATVSASKAGIMVVDANTLDVYLHNTMMLDLFDCSDREGLQRVLKEQSDHQLSSLGDDLRHALEYGSSTREIKYSGAEGERWLMSNLSALPGEQDNRVVSVLTDITDLKTYQSELKKSKAEVERSYIQLQSFMQHANAFIYIKDPAGRFIDVNHHMEALLGQSKEEITGKKVSSYFKRSCYRTQVEYDRYVLSNRSSIEYEIVFVTENRQLTVMEHKFPLVDENGHIWAICAIATDITMRKKIENELLETQKRYKSILDSSFSGLVIYADNAIIEANKNICQLFGFRVPEVINKHPAVLFGKNASTFPGLVSEQKKVFEISGRSKNGDVVLLEAIQEKCVYQGREACLIAVRDITAAKSSEERARKLGLILEESVSEIIIYDADTLNVVQINKTARNNLQLKLDEAFSKTIYDLHEASTHEMINVSLERLMNGEHDNVRIDSVHVRKDGTQYLTRERVQFTSFEGRYVYVAMVLDITEERRAIRSQNLLKAQVQNQQKLKAVGVLASGIAHEINNPVQGVMNYAELLKMHKDDPEKIEEYSQEILNESARVAGIVKNLLTFSRQESEEFESSSVYEIVEASTSLLRTIFRKQSVAITTRLPRGLPPVYCRPQQIQQVLINLITNARDAMVESGAEHPRIVLSVHRTENEDGKKIVFSVFDNGPGVDAGIQQNIFEPFFTTKSKENGTGLGLSVSHGIIHDHGGEIHVENRRRQGAAFTFSLPLNAVNHTQTVKRAQEVASI